MTSTDSISAQAAMWADRMNRSAYDSADGRRFDAWMNADPRHREAFAEISAIWDDPQLAEACLDPAATAQRASPGVLRRWRTALALGAVAACASAIAFIGVSALPHQYESGPGEIRKIVLADGSTVELGGNSSVDVQLLPWRRNVSLERGEASFDVAHEARRPFTVAVDAARVTVLGTAFHVDRMAHDRMVVGVSRGLVRVESGDATLAVAADEAAEIKGGMLERIPLQPEQQSSSNWFVARDAPLADLVEKLRRYARQPIAIGSDKAAAIRVTGRFDVSDVDGTLATLRQAYDVQTAGQSDIILR